MNSGSDAPLRARQHARRSRHARRVAPLAVAALVASGCAAGQVAQTSDQRPTVDGVNVTQRTMDLRGLSIDGPPTGLPSYPANTDPALRLVLVNNSTRTDTLTSVRTSVATSWANYADYNTAYQVQQAALAAATGSATPSESASESESTSPSASGAGESDSVPSGGSSDGNSTGGSQSSSGKRSKSASPSASASATALPSGTKSVVIAPKGSLSFGTPDATGALLLTGLRQRLFPGTTVRITFTFAQAGSITVSVPVRLGETPRGPEIGGAGESEGE